MKCYWKAHCVGDIEGGIALSKLAKLYEKTNEADQAAAAYTQVKLTLFACIENLVKYLSDAMLNFFHCLMISWKMFLIYIGAITQVPSGALLTLNNLKAPF